MGTAVEVETSDVKINVANLICSVKNIFYEIWWTERVLATRLYVIDKNRCKLYRYISIATGNYEHLYEELWPWAICTVSPTSNTVVYYTIHPYKITTF
jgi:hypothetical protein